MNSSPSLCKADISFALTPGRGIAAFGVAEAEPVSDDACNLYEQWISQGKQGGMAYLERYADVRRDPRLLLDGARSLVVCAFPYLPHSQRAAGAPVIASYAHGLDYHDVVRQKLSDAATGLADAFGGNWRVCVDTAPLRERYWAVKAGLGFIGRNQQLIVPGVGSYVFIGTIISTLQIAPSGPCTGQCRGCGRCTAACPGGALAADGSLDARRCLSYLTIEHRGDFAPDIDLHNCLYGCDRCQQVCPHNAVAMHALLPELEPSEELLGLTPDDVMAMTAERFRELFRGSAIKRTKLAGLQRNAGHILKQFRGDGRD